MKQLEEIQIAAKKANIHDYIESLPNGYYTKVTELGSSLSGGQRQRISLARAFLSDAPCILLDEPTSNLDVLNEGMLLEVLTQQSNKTIGLVSHRKSTIKRADKVYEISQGSIL